MEEPAGSGTALLTQKPWAGTPWHLVLPYQAAQATVPRKHTGLLVSVSISAGCKKVGVGFGVWGEPWLGDIQGFSLSGGAAWKENGGFGGLGQTEEMEGGGASTVGLTRCRGAGLRQAQKNQV